MSYSLYRDGFPDDCKAIADGKVAPEIGVPGAGAYSTHAREDTGEHSGPEATT